MGIEETVLSFKAEYYRVELSRKGTLKVKVNGNSMWPFLKDGDIVIIKDVDFFQVNVGDIVFIDVGNNMLCHRVFYKRKDFIVTKADTFIGFDPPVSKEALIGKITAKEKNGKIYNLDELLSYRARFFISRFSVILSFCYLPLRFIRRIRLDILSRINAAH